MHGLAIDDAAWSSRWRDRALPDKAILSLGLTGCALILPAWPGSVLVAIVATGNHFIIDAVAGALVVLAAWVFAINVQPGTVPQSAVTVRERDG